MNFPFLINSQTKEKTSINKPVFRIGSDCKYCDYFINDESVSPNHCDIISRDGYYSILDLNSTNGTSIDDIILTPNKEHSLQNHNRIRIGNITFLFVNENCKNITCPFLVDLQNGQIFAYINKPVFLIGRKKTYCNLFVDDESVSRGHCYIFSREDGVYSIIDCNSTNGTSVENTVLTPNEEFPLLPRDCIRIGNRTFLFMTESNEV